MPSCIKRSVQQQNIRFLHTRSQYTEEYFKFIRNIATINSPNMVSSNELQSSQNVCNNIIFICQNYILNVCIKLYFLGY
jgi:hypothetical protein